MKFIQKPPLGTLINWAHPLSRGLVGLWLFNENNGDRVRDLSGYTGHGTMSDIQHPPTVDSGWHPGRKGPVLAFDRANWEHINIPNGARLNPAHITIITTMKMMEADTTDRMFVHKPFTSHDAPYYQYWVGYDSASDSIWVGATIDGTYRGDTVGTTQIDDSQWHDLAMTYDGEYIKAYIDGVLEGTSASYAGSISGYATILRFGGYVNLDVYSHVQMDSVRIYDRALSAQEINWLRREPYADFETIGLSKMFDTWIPQVIFIS